MIPGPGPQIRGKAICYYCGERIGGETPFTITTNDDGVMFACHPKGGCPTEEET